MELETRRNIFHILAGIGFIILLYYDLINSLILFEFFSIALFISFISLYVKIPILYWFLKKFDRKEDINVFPGKGAVMFVLGVFIASLFPKDIMLAGIAILTLGDSFNVIFGVRGRVKQPFNNKRFIEGFLAGLVAAFIGALFFVSQFEAFIAATVAMMFEGLDMKYRINDNVMIPLISCSVIYLLRIVF
jgi:dolichol kinase